MKKTVLSGVLLMNVAIFAGVSDPELEFRDLVVLEGSAATAAVDLGGGAIVDFHLTGHDMNPLTWNYPEKGDRKPRQMGHFLCLGRWGPATPSETKNGMPWHGEATSVYWKVADKPSTGNGWITAEMSCELPIGGLTCLRSISLREREAVVTVTEKITNRNKLGRLVNVVQHATLGPPFLDESVVIDTEVKKGFTQKGTMPFPEEPVIYWPKAVWEGRLIDFRRLSGDAGPEVISFIIDESNEYGWVTASNPAKGLLIGYFWKTAEYPWLNLWRNVQDGKPAAYGLEFGTTGLHQPYPVLVEKGCIFGYRLYEYIDADETITKSYTAFLARIPEDYRGVSDISFDDDRVLLHEHGGDASRDIPVKIR